MKNLKELMVASISTVVFASLLPFSSFADDSTTTYDTDTETLYLHGNVKAEDVIKCNTYRDIRSVVAEEGAVLPEDCSSLFRGNLAYTFDLSLADTSQVTCMEGMFEDCECASAIYLDGWDTSKVKSMAYMFYNCNHLVSIDISDFSAESLIYQYESGTKEGAPAGINHMFADCTKLTTIYASNKWKPDYNDLGTTGLGYTFNNSTKLIGGSGSKNNEGDKNGWYASVDAGSDQGLFTQSSCDFDAKTGVLTLYGLVNREQVEKFAGRDSVKSVVVEKDTIFPNSVAGMFEDFKATSIDLTNANCSQTESLAFLFRNCTNLTDVNLPINTSKVETMYGMFTNCKSLTMLDLSSFDTSGLLGEREGAYAGIYEMFLGCENLETIYVSDKWNVNDVPSTIIGTFDGCDKLVGGEGTSVKSVTPENGKYAIVDGGTSNPGYLTDISKAARFSKMFPDSEFCAFVMDLCGTTSDLVTSADMAKIEATTELPFYDTSKGVNRIINDFSGIEYFKNLELIRCTGCTARTLDVSKNTKLEKLYCIKCAPLNTLVLNEGLKELSCYGCQITELDVSKCTKLTSLKCHTNPITSLDVSNCPDLQLLYCNDTKISKIDISKNTKLPYFNSAIEKQSYKDEKYDYIFWETEDAKSGFYVDSDVEIIDKKTVEPTPGNPTPAEPTPAEPTPAEPTPGNPTPAEPTPGKPTPELDVGAFVERCYTVGLSRASDKAGYDYWVDNLNSGKACGAQVGYGFIFSTEYIERNRTDEEFVTDLYAMYFDREPDAAGKAYWLDMLAGGAERETVFAGFANSEEFYNLCTKYGVACGTYLEKVNNEVQGGVNCFVARLYKVCLNRLPDMGGHAGWVLKLMNGEVTGSTCAYGFVFSPEFIGKSPSNEDFVNYMYDAFFGRAADSEGFAAWVKVLEDGGTYEEVFNGFTGSPEFANLCASYGIQV